MLQCCAKKKEGQDFFFKKIPSAFYYVRGKGGIRRPSGSEGAGEPGRGEERRDGGGHKEVLGWGHGVQNPRLCTFVYIYTHICTYANSRQGFSRGLLSSCLLLACTCTHIRKHLQIHIYFYRLN